MISGCAGRTEQAARRPQTEDEAVEYLRRAVRESSHGMLIFERNPTVRGVDRQRLREIAHELKNEGAKCFLERAIVSIEHQPESEEEPFTGVPAGQAKFRMRLRPDGIVARGEILESGFHDPPLESCVLRAIERKRFPRNDAGTLHSVDIVYWASLGFHKQARSPIFAERLRREATAQVPRARRCFRGHRLDAGSYKIAALNLFTRMGTTATNRVRHPELPAKTLSCLASAFKEVRVEVEPGSFIRPGFYNVEFTIDENGQVTVADEEWLRRVQLEERAETAARIEALGGPVESPETETPVVDNRNQESASPNPQDSPNQGVNQPSMVPLLNPRANDEGASPPEKNSDQ